MRQNKIRELRVETGDYLRVSQVPIRRTGSHKRGRRFAPTGKAQAKLNQRNAEYRLQEILQLNFPRGSGAKVLGVDYDNAHLPADCDEGIKIFKKYIRRINALLKKRGEAPAKYVYVTAYGTRSGRVHHHCVMSCALSEKELRGLWDCGRVHIDPVYYDASGLVGLSDYLARQSGSGRRWNSSKGLLRPVVKKDDDAISIRDARYIANNPYDADFIERLYPGWKVYRVITAAEPEEGGGLPGIYNTILLYRDGIPLGYDGGLV
ncbi:MAG: hypothetical protein IJY04_02275 [Clostridia bacterium]|nr:hypothetical protein [Clostridia bacterium]